MDFCFEAEDDWMICFCGVGEVFSSKRLLNAAVHGMRKMVAQRVTNQG